MRVIWFGVSLLSCREKDYISVLPEERQRSAAIKIRQVRPATAWESARKKKKGGKGREADLSCDDRFLLGFIHPGWVGDRGGRFPVGSCLGLCTNASGKAQMSIDTFVYQRNIQRYIFCFFSCRISGSVHSILCCFRPFCLSGKQQPCLADGEGRGLR